MAKNVVIREVVYQNVPSVEIPQSPSGTAAFYDVSDATITGGSQMLSGVTAYAGDGTKVTGSIATKTGADMTASGATVTAPAGYYASASSKSVASGSATTPATSITATPSITVSSAGLITASVSASQNVTPSVTAGYISAGTAGAITVSGSETEQLTTKAAATITPGTTDQTIASGLYLTGAQTIKGDSNLQPQYIAKNVSIFDTVGTLDAPVVSQDAQTKVLSIS